MKMHVAVVSVPPVSPDALADLEPVWAGRAVVTYSSVLPDLEPDSIRPYLAEAGDKVLMLGVGGPSPTAISINSLLPQLEKKLASLAGLADFAFFPCGGDFPRLRCPIPLVQPNLAFRNVVKTVLRPDMRIGVITPGAPQVAHVHDSWLPYLAEAGLSESQLVVDWSPPVAEAAAACARRLAAAKVDLVAVECLGFRDSLRREIAAIVGKPVFLVRTVAAQLLREMVGGVPSEELV